MRIFVDADACPKLVKEVLYRAAIRTQIQMYVVANRTLNTPHSPFIKMVLVPNGFDEADKRIAEDMIVGDLVITGDIPLADIVIEKGGIALNPRGSIYTRDNIKHKLAMRNLMAQLRDDQVVSGGPSTMNKNDVQALANALDKLLAQLKR